MDKLLTTKDAAGILRIEEETVRRWLRRGKLRGLKIGTDWRLTQRALEEFVGGATEAKEVMP
jgi:excisionase family DNA binding protein